MMRDNDYMTCLHTENFVIFFLKGRGAGSSCTCVAKAAARHLPGDAQTKSFCAADERDD